MSSYTHSPINKHPFYRDDVKLHAFPNKQTPVLQGRWWCCGAPCPRMSVRHIRDYRDAWRSRLCSPQEPSYTLSPINTLFHWDAVFRSRLLSPQEPSYTLSTINAMFYRDAAWPSRLCSPQEPSYTLSPISFQTMFATWTVLHTFPNGVLNYVHHRNCYTLSPISF